MCYKTTMNALIQSCFSKIELMDTKNITNIILQYYENAQKIAYIDMLCLTPHPNERTLIKHFHHEDTIAWLNKRKYKLHPTIIYKTYRKYSNSLQNKFRDFNVIEFFVELHISPRVDPWMRGVPSAFIDLATYEDNEQFLYGNSWRDQYQPNKRKNLSKEEKLTRLAQRQQQRRR